MTPKKPTGKEHADQKRFWMRIGMVLSVVLMALVIWASQIYLTRSFVEEEAAKAKTRATLYAGTIKAKMVSHSVAPLLLSRDPILTIPLRLGEFANIDEDLAAFQEELGYGAIFLLNTDGNVVVAGGSHELNDYEGDQNFFLAAIGSDKTEFTVTGGGETPYQFHYSRKLTFDDRFVGVIVVSVDLASVENSWRLQGSKVIVSDEEGSILLASEPSWRGRTTDEILVPENERPSVRHAIRTVEERLGGVPYVYFDQTPLLASKVPLGHGSWQLTYYSTLEDVRARVNAILAGIFMVLALLLALLFYLLSRRHEAESARIQGESDILRQLNRKLSNEIATRRRVEKNLQEAEQSLEQASKLAALGQMSAAVSHELNQPLAAMKTYLAGARLLLSRRRLDEAMTSFQRIDDLINRMGAITRQLKSYATKRPVELVEIDLRDSVREALSMMSPQLGKMSVAINTVVPSEPVRLRADPLRTEQIIVNLLRNALDAVRPMEDRKIDILLVEGESIVLSITDNGMGLKDPDQLFEPFYTTKRPGEGLGLGLAISAGFAGELGGRLVARNAPDGGAVFELILPPIESQTQAAE
ncbi:ATP-binding protein [Amaricoccus tamworthensis]|uniref:ATP-binding protein n=1 Tax=Amaricoccus tamworthensis TaxID=57002 RepID=UPI003C7B3D11